jgi:hypothetical protein
MKIDKENNLLIRGKKIKLVPNGGLLCFNTDIKELESLKIKSEEIHPNLIIRVNSSDGFGTYLFHQIEFFRNDDGTTQIVFICSQPNKYWEGKYGLSTLLMEIVEQSNNFQGIEANKESFEIDGDWKSLELFYSIEGDFELTDIISRYLKILNSLIKQAELSLSGTVWKKEYEKNEKLFSTEILYPLLRKMDFIDVRYTHGTQEYGKDFTFSELTSFGNFRHYGMQSKAGDMSGKVNSDIDEIIGQIDDAFSMPYFEVTANEKRRINTFIIAISGRFTNNAKEKIANKMPPTLLGSVYMLDRDKILELIERYWK